MYLFTCPYAPGKDRKNISKGGHWGKKGFVLLSCQHIKQQDPRSMCLATWIVPLLASMNKLSWGWQS